MNDLSREARQLLEIARDADCPDAEDRARVRRALAATLALGATSTAASAAATKTALGATKGAIGLWLAIGVATGLTTSAAVFIGVPALRAHAGQSPEVGTTIGGNPALRAHAERSPEVGTTVGGNPALQAHAEQGAATRIAAVPVATTEVAESKAAAAPEALGAPANEVVANTPSPAPLNAAPGAPYKNQRHAESSAPTLSTRGVRDAPDPTSSENAGTSASPDDGAPGNVAASANVTGTSLRAETSVLEEARAALDRGDAARALSLLDAHERAFPRGVLVEERLATRVFALCSLGRRAEALGVAQRFLLHAPASPLRARVLASCAGPR